MYSYIPQPTYEEQITLKKMGVKFGTQDFYGCDGFVLIELPNSWESQPHYATKSNYYLYRGKHVFIVRYFTVEDFSAPNRVRKFTGEFKLV